METTISLTVEQVAEFDAACDIYNPDHVPVSERDQYEEMWAWFHDIYPEVFA